MNTKGIALLVLLIGSLEFSGYLIYDRSQLLHQIEGLETALDSREAEVDSLQSQLSDMTSLIEGLEGQVAVLENEKSSLEGEVRCLEDEVNSLEEELGTEEKPTEPTSTFCVVGGFNVWFVDVEWAESLDVYAPERTGGRFLLVTLIVENIGKSSRLFGVVGEYFGATGSAEVVVIDSEGFEYPSFNKFPLHDLKIIWWPLPQMLDPRMTKKRNIAFDLPGDAHGLRLGLLASKGDN